jgi:hypothetical protein
VLILTHRSWATNPYGPPTKMRPHPQLERDAFFNQMEVQVGRQLNEDFRPPRCIKLLDSY